MTVKSSLSPDQRVESGELENSGLTGGVDDGKILSKEAQKRLSHIKEVSGAFSCAQEWCGTVQFSAHKAFMT
jgi:hypothetical protein